MRFPHNQQKEEAQLLHVILLQPPFFWIMLWHLGHGLAFSPERIQMRLWGREKEESSHDDDVCVLGTGTCMPESEMGVGSSPVM